MALHHGKDFYRTVHGQLVHVKGRDYEVKGTTDDDFARMYPDAQESPKEPGATTIAPKGTEPPREAAAPPHGAVSFDVDRDFEKMFGGDEAQPEPDPVPATTEPQAAEPSLVDQLQAIGKGHSANLGGFYVHLSTPSGKFFMVSKKNDDGTPMKAAVAKAIAAMHPAGYKKKQQSYLVPKDEYLALAAHLEAQVAVGKAPTKPKADKTPTIGSHPAFSQVKEGMQFEYGGDTYSVVNNPAVDGGIKLKADGKDMTFTAVPGLWGKKSWKDAFKFKGMGDQTGPKIGDTKLENGQTYVLNANHRWELVEKKGPATVVPKVAPLPKAFPFKQIGPQKGSNPGGLYEDAFGKKWYIKFPGSEDQAKSEMLAAKFYDLMGIGAPKVKLVQKDGKLGIASAFQEGLAKVGDGEALGAKAGVKEGFGADAWLANWDVVGLGYDNLLVGPDGKAVRIDPGGALDFRAQGGQKGPAFGNTVPEIHTLKDAVKNPQSASVFGSMTQEEMNQSMVPVLEMPDDVIAKAVQLFGPGDDNQKAALSAKLIARKNYLAKQFPEAEAIAHPPKPDPKRLPVDKAQIPKPPDFLDWNGQGKGLSATQKVNEANQEAAAEVHRAAMKGDLVRLKNLQVHLVDKGTGESKLIPIEQHPSTHVKQYWSGLVAYMDVVANPGSEKLKTYSLAQAEDVSGLSDAFPSKPFGKNTDNIDSSEVLGYFMLLGSVANPEDFRPKNAGSNVTPAEAKLGYSQYEKMPKNLKSYISNVQSTGSINHHFKGNDVSYGGTDIKLAIKESYEYAIPKHEGARLWRWMDIPSTMAKQLQQAEPGLLFQNTDSMCCSKGEDWGSHKHFGSDLLLEIHYAEGAKAMDSYGSHSMSSEQEITTLPGQRFMILSKGKASDGKTMKLELLMLPPDPTFVDSVDQFKKGVTV